MEPTGSTPTISAPIFEIIGLGAGLNDGITSENLDEYLYHNDWAVRPVVLQQPISPASKGSKHDNPHWLAGPLL